MNDCVLFLAGRYYSKDFPFYRKLVRGRFTVAVNGGYRFFRRARLLPDLLIGDLDSVGRLPRQISSRTTVISYPTDKDQTDTELALAYCLKHGAKSIDIVQPGIGDPDHFLANLFLMADPPHSKKKRDVRIRLLGPKFEAYYLKDSTHTFKNATGSTVSVVPVSSSIRLTCRGTAFDVDELKLKRGRARSARNRIISSQASIRVTGQAFLIRLLGRR